MGIFQDLESSLDVGLHGSVYTYTYVHTLFNSTPFSAGG